MGGEGSAVVSTCMQGGEQECPHLMREAIIMQSVAISGNQHAGGEQECPHWERQRPLVLEVQPPECEGPDRQIPLS